MNTKLALDGHIYTLTVGSVLTTNVSQTNLCWLLFTPTLKLRLESCLSLLLEWTTLTAPKRKHISKNSQLVYGRGSFTNSPTSPPYVAKQLTALFHTQPPFSSLGWQSVAPTINCVFWLIKAQPSTQSTWPRSPTRLGIRPRDLGLLNKYILVAFLLLLDTTLLSQAGITHYSQLLTLQHST